MQGNGVGEVPVVLGGTPAPPNALKDAAVPVPGFGAPQPLGTHQTYEKARRKIDALAGQNHQETHNDGPKTAGVRYGDDTKTPIDSLGWAGGYGDDGIAAGLGQATAKLARRVAPIEVTVPRFIPVVGGTELRMGKSFFGGPSPVEYDKLKDARATIHNTHNFMQETTPFKPGAADSAAIPDPAATRRTPQEFRDDLQAKINQLEAEKQAATRRGSPERIVAIDRELEFYDKFARPLDRPQIARLRSIDRTLTPDQIDAIARYKFTGSTSLLADDALKSSAPELATLNASQIANIRSVTPGLTDTLLEAERNSQARIAWHKTALFEKMPAPDATRKEWLAWEGSLKTAGTGGAATGTSIFAEEIPLAELNRKLAPVERGAIKKVLIGTSRWVGVPIVVGAANFALNDFNQAYGKSVDDTLSHIALPGFPTVNMGNTMEVITPQPLGSFAQGFAMMTREPGKNLAAATLYAWETNMTRTQRWLVGGTLSVGSAVLGKVLNNPGLEKFAVSNALITGLAEGTDDLYSLVNPLDKTNQADRAAAQSLSIHEGNFGRNAIATDAQAYKEVGNNDPFLLAKNYNRFVYYPKQSWDDALKTRQANGLNILGVDGKPFQEPGLQRLRHQIVLSQAEGMYLKDQGLTASQASRLYALGNWMDKVSYDPSNLKKFIEDVSDGYKSASGNKDNHLTEYDPVNNGHKEAWRCGVGLGMDIGGAASEALINAVTKSTWTQAQLIAKAGSDIRAKLPQIHANDPIGPDILEFDPKTKTFVSHDSAINDIVNKLNSDIKGLTETKQDTNADLDGIMSTKGNRAHSLETLIRTDESGWNHFDDNSLAALATRQQKQYEQVIEGSRKLADFKVSKLIPFYDGQVQIAQQKAAATPATDAINYAQQMFLLKYYQQQAENERLAAAKLYRDSALLNLGYAQLKVDDKKHPDPVGALLAMTGPNGARTLLDKANAIDQQLLQLGWKKEDLSADGLKLDNPDPNHLGMYQAVLARVQPTDAPRPLGQ
jgi:hypothetical protein